MQGSAKQQLIDEIVKWLPQGHIITEQTEKQNEQSVTVGWMNGYGTTSVVDVTFNENLLDEIQSIINSQDKNQLRSFRKKIEAQVVKLTAQHDAANGQPWVIDTEILAQ